VTGKKRLSPDDIIHSFQEKLMDGVKETRVERFTNGSKKTPLTSIWLRIDKDMLKEAVQHLMTLEPYPHFAVSSGYDLDDHIDLVYHFSIYYGERGREISINITVELPKSNPVIETITDLIPGSLISEQEKQEMLGVTIRGIPKDKRVFIADDFPKDIYPWRHDETGPKKMVRNLHKVKP